MGKTSQRISIIRPVKPKRDIAAGSKATASVPNGKSLVKTKSPLITRPSTKATSSQKTANATKPPTSLFPSQPKKPTVQSERTEPIYRESALPSLKEKPTVQSERTEPVYREPALPLLEEKQTVQSEHTEPVYREPALLSLERKQTVQSEHTDSVDPEPALSSLEGKQTVQSEHTDSVDPEPALSSPEEKPTVQSGHTESVGRKTTVPPKKKLTVGEFLKEELNNPDAWCIGFSHGTRYDALLSILNSAQPAILPYKDLPDRFRKTDRRNEWKTKVVFFRLVKKANNIVTREQRIINSLSSTGASGGVILFMPIGNSLDFNLISLCGSDTQAFLSPATPSKAVYDSLENSGNLSLAEIAFKGRIPLSRITDIFLLPIKLVVKNISAKDAREIETAVADRLHANGFQLLVDRDKNSRKVYRHFVRQSSARSLSSTNSL